MLRLKSVKTYARDDFDNKLINGTQYNFFENPLKCLKVKKNYRVRVNRLFIYHGGKNKPAVKYFRYERELVNKQ